MTSKILRPATICKDTERHKVKSDKAVYPMRRCAPAIRDGVALSGNELSARSYRGAWKGPEVSAKIIRIFPDRDNLSIAGG